jgi:uncharacterized protein
VHVARWADWSGRGLQHVVLTERADAIVAEAVCIVAEEAVFAARYRIQCDAEWRCRELDVEVIGAARTLRLRGDGRGHWADGDGMRLAALNGAVDVDLPITPFTNTLPIRRLGLAVGESAEITAAWVDVETLLVVASPQRYTRLDERRWRFEALSSGFVAELEVDEHGLVLDYPDLFHRVLA